MGSTTVAGTTIAISAALPSTEDKTGYAALTFTKIGGVESLGPIGATTSKIEFDPLDGPKEKHKGSTDYGSLNPSLAHDKADAGQTLMRTAGEPENNARYAFKVTYPTGDKRYFQGRVFGYPETIGNRQSLLMANPTIEIDTKIVKDDTA
jgi:hypothetical protein